MSQSDNKLLASLPASEYQRLRPLLRTLHLPAETGLPHCGQTRVYFPGTGLCSIINKMADGSAIEVACIGSEGVVGSQGLSDDSPHDRNGFVQVADGTVQYLPSVLFERELARNGRFRELIDTFSHAFLETMIQAVACNRLHTLEERCCRWLLGVHDRLGRARFELKVRFLARAMGVKNSAVAGIMASLEDQGLASHDGSSVTILDSIGLRRLACRCYDAMKRGYTLERLAAQPRVEGPHRVARVLTMRQGVGACTLCGSSTRVPHRNGHECILALDEEIDFLVQRTHLLRKYRGQLMANRAQLYRDILKRSNSRI
ncbi:MAG TPA: Crp/Fnr family transcriptional regulator [Steroidobacteraceae bacterium]